MNRQEKAGQNNDCPPQSTERRDQNLNEEREGSAALVSTFKHLTLINAMDNSKEANSLLSDNKKREYPNLPSKSKKLKMIVKNQLLKRMRLVKVKLRLKRDITKLVDLKRKTAHFYDVMIQSKRTTLEKLKKNLEEYRRQFPGQLQQTQDLRINRRRGRMHLDNVDLYQEIRDQENNVPHGLRGIRPHPG